MINTKTEFMQSACEFWELSMLGILLKKGVLSEEEYIGITQIVKDDYINKKLCLKS